MTSDLISTLIEVMELPGPTGQEEPVLSWCRERWAALGAAVEASPVGNVIARAGGSGPRLLIQGHADEIGYVVKSVDERGFVWLADGQAGGSKALHHRHPVGQPALVMGRRGGVPGLFATVTGHVLSTRRDEAPLTDMNDLFVDLGVESRAEAEALGVFPGAGVIWNSSTRRLGNRLHGKAIDDRVSIAIMTHLLERVPVAEFAYDVTLAATVQEEIGLIGAFSLGQRGSFDLAIAIDNGPIGDYPGVDPREMPVRLGHGAALVYKDSWSHYDRRIISRLKTIAERDAIPVQECIFPGFGSDGGALIRAGIPTALLAIATRYTHSPFEMADVRDVEAALDLLAAFVTTPPRPLEPGPS